MENGALMAALRAEIKGKKQEIEKEGLRKVA